MLYLYPLLEERDSSCSIFTLSLRRGGQLLLHLYPLLEERGDRFAVGEVFFIETLISH